MSSPFISNITIVPFSFAPKGWAICAGQLMPITQNTALFSLLGTTYGGDGKSNFALPDLQGRTPVGADMGGGTALPLGVPAGAETFQLTAFHMPPHNHVMSASSRAVVSGGSPSGAYPASNGAFLPGPGNTTMSSNMVSSVGGQPIPMLKPYLVTNFIIALQGVYPARP